MKSAGDAGQSEGPGKKPLAGLGGGYKTISKDERGPLPGCRLEEKPLNLSDDSGEELENSHGPVEERRPGTLGLKQYGRFFHTPSAPGFTQRSHCLP